MDTKPTSSSALKARILLDSCTGRLPSDSLMEEMEKALDHAKKFTITMDDVFLGEGNRDNKSKTSEDSVFLVGSYSREIPYTATHRRQAQVQGDCCSDTFYDIHSLPEYPRTTPPQEKNPYWRGFFTPKECGVGASSKRSLIKRNKP